MLKNFTKNDVFEYCFTEEELKRRNHGNNGGTTYWTSSQYLIFDGEKFIDTFWLGDLKSPHYNSEFLKVFKIKDLSKLELTYLCNLDNYRAVEGHHWTSVNDCYDDEDLLNLCHPNYTGNWYLKEDAKISLLKIERSLQIKLAEVEESIKQLNSKRGTLEVELEHLYNGKIPSKYKYLEDIIK